MSKDRMCYVKRVHETFCSLRKTEYRHFVPYCNSPDRENMFIHADRMTQHISLLKLVFLISHPIFLS